MENVIPKILGIFIGLGLQGSTQSLTPSYLAAILEQN